MSDQNESRSTISRNAELNYNPRSRLSYRELMLQHLTQGTYKHVQEVHFTRAKPLAKQNLKQLSTIITTLNLEKNLTNQHEAMNMLITLQHLEK